jgi:hypothetical protein
MPLSRRNDCERLYYLLLPFSNFPGSPRVRSQKVQRVIVFAVSSCPKESVEPYAYVCIQFGLRPVRRWLTQPRFTLVLRQIVAQDDK